MTEKGKVTLRHLSTTLLLQSSERLLNRTISRDKIPTVKLSRPVSAALVARSAWKEQILNSVVK